MYEAWSIMGFNVAFTALPVMSLALVDQDIPKHAVLLQQHAVWLAEPRCSGAREARAVQIWPSSILLQCLGECSCVSGMSLNPITGADLLGDHWHMALPSDPVVRDECL